MDMLDNARVEIVAREGWIFIFIFGLVSAVFFIAGVHYVAWPVLFLTIFTVFFFRNPERRSEADEGEIVSPADGTVLHVQEVSDNEYTDKPAKKISIFMSVFNVHVNRFPVKGVVQNIRYHPGKFFVASTDKACEHNERNAIFMNTEKGEKIAIVQIAGIIARRIVCFIERGENVLRGQRLGLIRFGSRVDLYLSLNTEVTVSAGQKVRAGRTVIGRFK